METDPWSSHRPKVLLAFRGVFGLLTLGICIVGLVAIPAIYFAYLTHWGVCSVLLFYALSLASLRWKALVKAVKPLFTIAWCLEWVIVPIYWTWVYTQESSVPWAYTIVVHALLLLFLLCDYFLNRLYFEWKHLAYPLVVLGLYTAVNVPVTVEEGELYPRVNYENGWSYLVIVYTLLMCLLGFLLAKGLDRVKRNRERRTSGGTELLGDQP